MKKREKLAGGSATEADASNDAGDWSKLARELEVSREAVRQWRKIDGAPKEPKIDAWRKFRDEHGLGKGAGSAELAGLRAEKLRVEIQASKLKLARERGQYIAADDVRAFDVAYAAKLDAFLRVKLVLEVPNRVAGKTIQESRQEMEAVLGEVREFQRGGVVK